MADVRIYYVRLSDYTLSATATDAQYPLTNLQTYFARDQWRGANTNANQQVAIDFGSARACDSIVIENHNFSGLADVGIILQGADNSGFSTNLVNAVGDLTTSTTPYAVEFSSITRRYWRIYFASSSPLTAIPRLGNWFLGARFQFTSVPYDFDAEIGNASFITSEGVALDGSLRMSQAYTGRKLINVNFRMVDNTIRANWQAFVNTTRGKLLPFYFTDVDGTLYYGHLDRDYAPARLKRYQVNDLETFAFKAQQATVS